MNETKKPFAATIRTSVYQGMIQAGVSGLPTNKGGGINLQMSIDDLEMLLGQARVTGQSVLRLTAWPRKVVPEAAPQSVE